MPSLGIVRTPEVAPTNRTCRRTDAAPVSGGFPAGSSFKPLEPGI